MVKRTPPKKAASATLHKIGRAVQNKPAPAQDSAKRSVHDVLMGTKTSTKTTPSAPKHHATISPEDKQGQDTAAPDDAMEVEATDTFPEPKSPPPPTRTSYSSAVGFSTEITEVQETTNEDGITETSIKKNLTQAFSQTNRRKHFRIMTARLAVEPSGPEATKTGRKALKQLYTLMIQQDPTAILYSFRQTNPTESDACKNPAALPSTITALQKFFDSFRPNKDGGDLWVNFRVGIDGDPSEFVDNLEQELTCYGRLDQTLCTSGYGYHLRRLYVPQYPRH